MHFSLSNLYLGVVILCFLCSLISFRLHYSYPLRLFSFFLGITAVTEIIANFFIHAFHLTTNFPVYNIFILVEYPLLAFYFKQIITDKKVLKIVTGFMVLFPFFWLYIYFFVYNLNKWNTYSGMIGDLFTILFAARYLYELFTSDELIHLDSHPEFWIAVALIFYSCCELPITGLLNFWVPRWEIAARLLSVLQILNIIMYSIFIYAYLCPLKVIRKKL